MATGSPLWLDPGCAEGLRSLFGLTPERVSNGQRSLWLVRFLALPELAPAVIQCPDYHLVMLVDQLWSSRLAPHPDGPLTGDGSDVILIPAGGSYQIPQGGGVALTLLFFSRDLVMANPINPGLIWQLSIAGQRAHPMVYELIRALQGELLTEPSQRIGLYYQQLVSKALFLHLTQADYAIYQATLPQAGLISPDHLRQLTDYIGAHLHGEIRLSHLAALVDLPETQLFQGFQQAMGVSPQQYIQVERLRAVHQLFYQLALTSGLEDSNCPDQPGGKVLPPRTMTGSSYRAMEWINQRVLEHTGQALNDTQNYILAGVLEGQRYGEMAQARGQSEGHFKTTAAKLWETLSTVLGEPVRKSNLLSYLSRQGLPMEGRKEGRKEGLIY